MLGANSGENLADAAKDVAGELQDKAAGVYDAAKERVKARMQQGSNKAKNEL